MKIMIGTTVSSRTVLAKGLEFDVAIVDLRYDIDARNFYVAISRATRRVVLLTKERQNLRCALSHSEDRI